MDVSMAIPGAIYIGSIIYIVALLNRIARAVERVAANTEGTPVP